MLYRKTLFALSHSSNRPFLFDLCVDNLLGSHVEYIFSLSRTNRSCGWGELLIKYHFWPLEMSRIPVTRGLKSCSSIQTIGNSWWERQRSLNSILSVHFYFCTILLLTKSTKREKHSALSFNPIIDCNFVQTVIVRSDRCWRSLLTVAPHFLPPFADKSDFPRRRRSVYVSSVNSSTARICNKSHRAR